MRSIAETCFVILINPGMKHRDFVFVKRSVQNDATTQNETPGLLFWEKGNTKG